MYLFTKLNELVHSLTIKTEPILLNEYLFYQYKYFFQHS